MATEAYDFNTGLLTPQGDILLGGIYISAHASVQDLIVRYVLERYKDNPGIGEDDMFITGDPYVGALHQSDVTCIAPIHWRGELVAWCGCTVHQVDVGGPVPGSVTVGAVLSRRTMLNPHGDPPGRVYINQKQYFEGVELQVWAFQVGGYQVLEKWLKYRKGRKLSWADAQT